MDGFTPEAWQTELVRTLKSGKTAPLSLVDFDGRALGRIECMSARHLDDDELVATFVRWRNQNRAGWLDQRPVTVESTRAWMRRALDDDRRLNRLFYAGDRLIGRGGMLELTRRSYMSDGIVRGGRGGGLSFMHFVNFACMGWDFEHLDLAYMDSKVVETNSLAMSSTNVLGYRVVRRVPLRIARGSDGDVLTEASEDTGAQPLDVDRRLCYLRVSRGDFESARDKAWRERSFDLNEA